MPRGAGCSRGVPARLACLLLLALIAVVCLATGADAKKRPAACPNNPDGTVACNNCVKKNCKFDDRCLFDKAAANSPTSPGSFCRTAATKVNPDVCQGIQRKHGKNAPAIVSATGVGGKAGKRARCLASVSPQNNSTTVPCGCMTKKGNPANRRCPFCVPSKALVPCTDGTIPGTSQGLCPTDPGTGGDVSPPGPPGPPGPPSPPTPPSPPVNPNITTNFLVGNVMTMQGGAVKYTPSTNNGNWTTLCQIPQQAKAIKYGAELKVNGVQTPDSSFILSVWTGTAPVPGLAGLYPSKPASYNSVVLNTPFFMEGTKYFDNAKAWYTGGLSGGGGMAPSSYVGTGKDFLDSYFRTGIQTPAGSKALSGSSSASANAQILMKSSAYWVAVTHVMYNLDMAEKNIAANNTAAAKANFDSVAAAYFGCGDTNPVPLPKYNGADITPYPATIGTPDTGFNTTTMSVYGVANKRADNYGTAGLVSLNGVTCTSASATCKTVAAINVEVGAALNAGPTAANIDNIRDATLTIFTQAAQRYIAKLTLAAHLPGDGMGGSTAPNQVTSTDRLTTGSYVPGTIGSNAAKNMQTACGQGASYVSVTGAPAAQPVDATANAASALVPATPFVSSYKVTGVNSCGQSATVGLKGSPESNTATFGAVMAEVKGNGDLAGRYVTAVEDAAGSFAAEAGGTAATGPFKVASLPFTTNNANAATTNGGSSTNDIIKATRGLPAAAGVPAATVLPIACIGPTVTFAQALNNGAANAAGVVPKIQKAVALCDPSGLVPPAAVAAVVPDGTNGAARASAYGGTTGARSTQFNFWDPVTASLLTRGGFCCNALIYGSDGLGRPATSGALPSSFVPPMSGGDMSGATSPGGMCPVSGTSIVGIQGGTSPTEVNQLEGQAFYAVMAPMQYTMQTTSTTAQTQASNAAKQKVCAQTITKMMKVNQVAATTPTGPVAAGTNTATCANPNGGATTSDLQIADASVTCRGSDTNALDYPLWKVKIGSTAAGTGGKDYFVPNGYCYANACFEDFVGVGLNASFKGATKLGALVKSPDMSSNPTTTGTAPAATGACGRANKSCAAAPSGWTGGAAEFVLCPITNLNAAGSTTCTTAQQEAQTGRIPIA